MVGQTPRAYSEKVFEGFKDLIRAKLAEGWTQTQIGDAIGYSQTAVSQWLSGARGRNIGLGAIWSAYQALGGDMEALLSEVFGQERAAALIAWGDRDPEFLEAILDLVNDSEDEVYQKLKDDVLFYRRQKTR
jgi:transcriptional regulator with XRE-family HTH domain